MYFKVSMRTNPETGIYSGYYRLVESYRNHSGRVCHRTLLNAGFLDALDATQRNLIQNILTEKAKNPNGLLFNLPMTDDPVVFKYVEAFYSQMVAEKRIDVPDQKLAQDASSNGKDLQLIDINSIRNKDVREIGAEWMSYQAMQQLQIGRFLTQQGWSTDDIRLAQSHIIARAVYPASELETARWMRENSSVCEITGYDIEKVTKDQLYRISKKLYAEKEALEQHLSMRTNELFDIEDKIMLYDLTNTYFEGRKEGSRLAKFGRSKEKRSDAKLVVLALVVNPQGFIKYSSVLQGNMADPNTLEGMINNLRVKTSSSAKKALVVIDAGIATDKNLAMIKDKGYDYLCVSRSSLKKYQLESGAQKVTVTDNKKQEIALCRVKSDRNTDYYLKVESPTKALKERSMNEQFRQRFEEGLKKIADSLGKKGGVKQEDKVYERIGRLKQKYPSIQRFFDIEIEVKEAVASKQKTKDAHSGSETKRIATSIKWTIKQGVDINGHSGVYFLRTSLEESPEAVIWQFYNVIREIESTFRVLKTDLDLRPIYHKNDDSTMAHLHLGLLAYWLVNTIRHQLKPHGINSGWREIVRTMNTQKAVTTLAQNQQDQVIMIRRCSEPNQNVRKLYDALKYKYAPFTKRKSVVHKSELENEQFIEIQAMALG
ncbi:MAG: IS1634 family transposase [Bacteroidales bacterium]|nr:IS1634 family transposase [Bacteroidales bacterium]